MPTQPVTSVADGVIEADSVLSGGCAPARRPAACERPHVCSVHHRWCRSGNAIEESFVHQTTMSTSLLDNVAHQPLAWHIHWLFRLALFCEFVGHGAFGVLTKPAWVAYFALFGIPEAWAWKLMPVVGSVDIALVTLTLVAPTRAALLYMTGWGFLTAMLRPLAGEGWWEFFERAYNFGVPGLMLWVHSPGTTCNTWFTVITDVPRLTMARAQQYQWALRGIMASMLIGHGGFGLVMGKQSLFHFYDAAGLGVFGVPLPTVSAALGGCEMLLGLCCLVAQGTPFFLFVCVWKLGTELCYVPAQAYGAWWEVIERGSSYAAPLLWIAFAQVVQRLQRHGPRSPRRPLSLDDRPRQSVAQER
jgi:hypothetical protein